MPDTRLMRRWLGQFQMMVLGGLVVLVTALPVLVLRTPPFIDVLGHMGRYALQTGLAQHPALQRYYSFDWQLIGNLGADLIVEVMQPVLGVVGATKLAIAAVPLIGGSAMLILSRLIHGRVTSFTVAALVLIYALPFNWGFLNFSLSMAVALLAFTLWLHMGDRPARMLMFIPISLLLWLCHTFGWAFLGLLCTADSLAQGLSQKLPLRRLGPDILRRGLPLLAPLAPMILWRSAASGVGIDGWFDWNQKATWLLSIQRLDSPGVEKLFAAALLFAGVAGTALPWFRLDGRLALAAGLALAAFLALPKQIFGSVFADMRLAPYVVMLGLLAIDDTQLRTRPRRMLMVFAVLFTLVRLTLTAQTYLEREQQLNRELAALAAVPPHARLATLVQIPCQSDWTLPWFSHIGSIAIIKRDAFANDQWANASMNPLRVHYPDAEPFATDDRQLFFPPRCRMAPQLSQALKALPIQAFSHVWVVGVPPAEVPFRSGLTPIWRGDDAVVFRVERPRVADRTRIRKLSKLQP